MSYIQLRLTSTSRTEYYTRLSGFYRLTLSEITYADSDNTSKLIKVKSDKLNLTGGNGVGFYFNHYKGQTPLQNPVTFDNACISNKIDIELEDAITGSAPTNFTFCTLTFLVEEVKDGKQLPVDYQTI